MHILIHAHTHTKCTYARTQARLERRCGSDRARSWCRRRKLCTSLSFDAIKPHLAPPMLGLHCTHFLRHQYPSTPHALFPTYPRTVCRPCILSGRDYTVPHWSTQQSAPLCRSSAQLHNGPLRSCRKIGRKAAVQQSRSRRARRNSSPRMTKVTVHEKRKVSKKHQTPATAHHTITTAQRPDNIRSSTLVRGRSTQFMANPCRWPQKRSPETRLHFRYFRGLFHIILYIYIYVMRCRLVALYVT